MLMRRVRTDCRVTDRDDEIRELERGRQSTRRLALGRREPPALRALRGGTGRARPRCVLGKWQLGGRVAAAADKHHPDRVHIVNDPIGLGFVQSLPHPGSNVTGFSPYEPSIAGKWLGMLTQITPPVARVAVLSNLETNSEPCCAASR
jgi:hypothetical protein